jgi:hypothetical protein
VIDPVLEQDPASLADLAVPTPFQARPGEDGISRDRLPRDEILREILGKARNGEGQQEADVGQPTK